MLNCSAVTTETSANPMRSSELGMVHQKYLQLNHGLVMGFRLDLGKGNAILGKIVPFGQSNSWRSVNGKTMARERHGPWGRSTLIPVGIWLCTTISTIHINIR